MGGRTIFKGQAKGDLSIPAIESSSRVSIQQIAAQSNSELLHYYSSQANGALPSSKKTGKLCTIPSSLALIPDEERLSDLDEVEACSSRAAGSKKRPSDAATQPTTIPALRTSLTKSFGLDRTSFRIENDGDEEPGQSTMEDHGASMQTLPCLQNTSS